MPDGTASRNRPKSPAESSRAVAIRWIDDAVRALPLDADGAWWLADDDNFNFNNERFDGLVAKIAVYLAGKTEAVLGLEQAEFLGLIRARLETKVGAMMNADKRNEGRRIPGMDLIREWRSVDLEFGYGYGYDWGADLDEILPRSWGPRPIERQVGAARLLNAVHAASQDKQALTQLLLPIVTRDDSGERILRRRRADWTIEGLHLTHGEKDESVYKLAKIVDRREKKRGFVYPRAELAQYLEAVLLSPMPQVEKDAFLAAMLHVRPFVRGVSDYRPGYGGKNDLRQEAGVRITLPTGVGFELLDDGELRLFGENDPEQADLRPIDAVFFMALIDSGRLPMSAMDAFYQFDERPNGLTLHVHVKRFPGHASEVKMDFVASPLGMSDFPSLYAAFLLSRDRRLSDQMRSRLRWLFESDVKPQVETRIYAS